MEIPYQALQPQGPLSASRKLLLCPQKTVHEGFLTRVALLLPWWPWRKPSPEDSASQPPER